MTENKPIKSDSGERFVREAVLDLLNQFPNNPSTIRYGFLDDDGGISMEVDMGAVVLFESKDIIGNIHKRCQYPFIVVVRGDTSGEWQKINVSDYLEKLGSWLCREPGSDTIAQYPNLSGGRKITGIERSNVYALVPNENHTQDWCLPVTVNYTHDYQSW